MLITSWTLPFGVPPSMNLVQHTRSTRVLARERKRFLARQRRTGTAHFFFFFHIRRNSLESDTKNKTATIHLIFNPSDPRLLILNSQLLTQSGMDFFVVLERPGFRVAKRRRKQSKIGAPHKLKKTDAMTFFKKNFEGIILNKAYE